MVDANIMVDDDEDDEDISHNHFRIVVMEDRKLVNIVIIELVT